MTLNLAMSGDTRRETRRLANRWHGAKKSPKEKVSHLEVRTGVRLDWEFDDPIGVLKDCHRKIRRSLHVLWVIADRAAGRELTSDEIAAVRSAMNCLRVDGSRHTADEERSLFPRLRAQTISGDSEDLIALEVNRRQTDRLSAMVEAFYST